MDLQMHLAYESDHENGQEIDKGLMTARSLNRITKESPDSMHTIVDLAYSTMKGKNQEIATRTDLLFFSRHLHFIDC